MWAQGDDYNHIMIEAVADRLAEAFAEKLHELVRREVWAYAADEKLTPDDMLKVKYQGKPQSPQAPPEIRNSCRMHATSNDYTTWLACLPCQPELWNEKLLVW